ncbi:MAG: GNAT family N-acetyltransferase [Cyanobacteria bacterium J06627_28]
MTSSFGMQFQIRLADAADMPAILTLQALSLRALSQGVYTHSQIEVLVRSQDNARERAFWSRSEVIYVACVSDGSRERLVGFVALVDGVRARIGGLYVHPDYTRQGAATQLIGSLEAHCIEQGGRVLRVMSSKVAVPFYRAVGFTQLSELFAPFEKERVACVEMAKALGDKSLEEELAQSKTLSCGGLLAGLLLGLSVALLLFYKPVNQPPRDAEFSGDGGQFVPLEPGRRLDF